MKKIWVVFLFIFFWPMLAWADGLIFISQVQITRGTGKTTEDFIEIFNPSDNQANLNGFRLVKRTGNGDSDTLIKSWTSDTFIPARSFYLWANSGFTDISKTPDITTSGSISDNNGTALRLGENDTGTIIDSISWGTANNGFSNLSLENPEANMALFRQNLYSPSSEFLISSSSPRNTTIQESLPLGTSTPDTTASSTPDTASTTPENLTTSFYVKIYRFLPNPSGEDSGREWVELQNLDEMVVNLEDWLIDDKDIGSGPGADVFVLTGVISPGEIKKFVLPEGSFALNNSGGDEVNLYFADKSLAQKAVYSVAAYDDGIFEYRDEQWQPPAQSSGVSGGSSGGTSGSSSNTTGVTSNILSTPTIQFKLNEFFPNPLGDDAGKEWVEIFNPESATSSLEGYFLADGTSDSWSSSAWIIPKNVNVPGKGLLAIMLPKTSFTLNNRGTERVKLFSPQKQLIDSISFKDAEENRSWAKNLENVWEWGLPTFNLPNNTVLELPKIYISELLPSPSEDQEEFVEIFNNSTSTINLDGMVLQIGNRSKVFVVKDKISTNRYFVITEDDLPARLSNNGQTLKLLDPFGRIISETTYSKALVGHSWVSMDGNNFSWTGNLSPGEENMFVLGEAVEQSNLNDKSPTKKVASTVSNSDVKKILASNLELQEQVFALQESVDLVNSQLALLEAQKTETSQNETKVVQNRENGGFSRIISFAVGILVLLAILFYVFKYHKF